MQESDIDNLLSSIFSEDTFLNIREMFDEKLKTLNVSKTKVLNLLKIDKDVFEQIISGTAKQPNLIHIIKIANFLDLSIDKFIEAVLKNQSPEMNKPLYSSVKRNFSDKMKDFWIKSAFQTFKVDFIQFVKHYIMQALQLSFKIIYQILKLKELHLL